MSVCLCKWEGVWSVRPRNGSGDPPVGLQGMASLIGSGMASDSLSSRLADDVPCEVSGRLEGVSVREHRGLFCSGCVDKKCSSWSKKRELPSWTALSWKGVLA